MSGATLNPTAADTVVLEWQGPYSFLSDHGDLVFVGPVSQATGLFLWTVRTPSGFLIRRVGKTGKPFWQRHVEHLKAMERGTYPIHRAASLAEGRPDPIYPGLHGDEQQQRLIRSRFHNSRQKLQKELAGTLSLMAIFLAPCGGSGLRARQRIQTVLQRRLTAIGGQESAFLERPLGNWPRMPGEAPIQVRSVAGGRIRGVEGEFEA